MLLGLGIIKKNPCSWRLFLKIQWRITDSDPWDSKVNPEPQVSHGTHTALFIKISWFLKNRSCTSYFPQNFIRKIHSRKPLSFPTPGRTGNFVCAHRESLMYSNPIYLRRLTNKLLLSHGNGKYLIYTSSNSVQRHIPRFYRRDYSQANILQMLQEKQVG